MKTILSTLLAVMMLIGMLGGCARDMSGETRTPPAATATTGAEATEKPSASPAATDSTADGVIDEGRDAVDGVVGAGEDAVNDVVDGAEDMVNDVTGNDAGNATDAGSDGGAAQSGRDNTVSPSPSPSAGQ